MTKNLWKMLKEAFDDDDDDFDTLVGKARDAFGARNEPKKRTIKQQFQDYQSGAPRKRTTPPPPPRPTKHLGSGGTFKAPGRLPPPPPGSLARLAKGEQTPTQQAAADAGLNLKVPGAAAGQQPPPPKPKTNLTAKEIGLVEKYAEYAFSTNERNDVKEIIDSFATQMQPVHLPSIDTINRYTRWILAAKDREDCEYVLMQFARELKSNKKR